MQSFDAQLEHLAQYRTDIVNLNVHLRTLEHYDMLVSRMRNLRADIARYMAEVDKLWKEKHAFRAVLLGLQTAHAGQRKYRDICIALENAERQLADAKTQFWETNAVVREMKAEPKDLWGKVEQP